MAQLRLHASPARPCRNRPVAVHWLPCWTCT